MSHALMSIVAAACSLWTCAAVAFVPPGAPAGAIQAGDAASHKAWMNDASDEQENYRFAVADRDVSAATAALVKLESLMGKTESYWSARSAADGVRLAKAARAQASEGIAALKAGDAGAAARSFEALSATCNACHELHLEKR